MTIEIKKKQFTLLHDKALYKHDERLLIIADVHLGKASHFRKEGIPIPAHSQISDYNKLAQVFLKTNPLKVYFLGDLFHSDYNRDWHYFTDLVSSFPNIEFTLVRGNHDRVDDAQFRSISVTVVDKIEDDNFVYTHEATDRIPKGKINVVGHIHPGVVLSGIARQSVKLPCFYLHENTMILPAFGILTGLYSMELYTSARVWIVTPSGIQEL
jgi:DNA ligase-associated metallophosphoesterase